MTDLLKNTSIGTVYKGSVTRDGFRIVWADGFSFPDGETPLYAHTPAALSGDLPNSELVNQLQLLFSVLPPGGPSQLIIQDAMAALSGSSGIQFADEQAAYEAAIRKTMPPMDAAHAHRWWFGLGYRAGQSGTPQLAPGIAPSVHCPSNLTVNS
jgi:hypothetical protein